MKKYDIVAIGECLIDFVASPGTDGTITLKGNPGGAPANVLAAAAKLGLSTAFIGKVGGDAFGDFLVDCLEKSNIDISSMIRAKEPTTLAIVSLNEGGEREFSFYRDRTADVMLSVNDLPLELIENTAIFHFGSVSMTAEPSRKATIAAAGYARSNGALISFDPNLRPMLWSSLEDAKEQMLYAFSLADVVKVSHEEAEFLTGISEPFESGKTLFEQYGFKLLAVTMAERGCIIFTPGLCVSHSGYSVESVDTTGAGDAFWGCLLTKLRERDCITDSFTESELEILSALANAAGALAVTKYGAIPAMPGRDEINKLCK